MGVSHDEQQALHTAPAFEHAGAAVSPLIRHAARGRTVLDPRLSDAERLTAGWLGVAVVLAAARVWVLLLAESTGAGTRSYWPWLPLAVYQDLCVVVGLAWLFDAVLGSVSRVAVRRMVRALGWLSCVAAAWYAVVSAEIFRFLSTPLTYRLIAMSDNLRGIRNSMEAALTEARFGAMVATPAVAILIAAVLIRFGRGGVRRLRAHAARWSMRGAFAAYIAAAALCTRWSGIDATIVANPHAAMALSFLDRADPFVSGSTQAAYAVDFEPHPAPPAATQAFSGLLRDCNVLMVVMESVGALPMGHYGARFDTTPELTRLAARGWTFDRIYSSQPYTSNAMAAMFCSIYPWHGWRSVPRRAPELNVAGLGNVLQAAGYRTAMLHTGDMQFDNEKRFLQYHGFSEVHDVWSLHSLLPGYGSEADTPPETPGMHLHLPDRLLVPAAAQWLDRNRGAPFFLTLWTIQTHHPYFPEPSAIDFSRRDEELNRYLNAIRVSDGVLGDVVRELESRGLADSTLIVVLGDHGEAFGEHGQRGHSKTLYEEELRVPLVMIAPRLPQAGRRFDMLGQHIDVAPTVLELLDLPTPPAWQGRSLFAPNRSNRAYLFTAFHHYLFGVIDGHTKYVYNATTDKAQLYDLRRDPAERHNLMSRAASAETHVLHERLATWARFQNQYLSQFVPESDTRRARSIVPVAN